MKPTPPKQDVPAEARPSLKQLAEHLGLSPATVSLVVNNAPGARSIPQKTRDRILAAAKKLDYKPNFFARSLRTRQSFTIGVVVPEFSEGYFTMVMNAIEEHLLQSGYLHFVVSHQGRSDLIDGYPRLLTERAVDGFILVNTVLHASVSVPVVSISGHKKMRGLTNIMLDHDHSAMLALRHLYDLGHRDIVFMKGQPHALDSESRWESIRDLAESIGIRMRPELCISIRANSWSPELGYPIVRSLLESRRDFTAIFCFNDIAAMGAVRAIVDAGLRCPEDISVVGFDDITSAAYTVPRLTTIRQPLRRMGEMAAQLLLKRIQNPGEAYPDTVMFEPELIVRESTAPPRKYTSTHASAKAAPKTRKSGA